MSYYRKLPVIGGKLYSGDRGCGTPVSFGTCFPHLRAIFVIGCTRYRQPNGQYHNISVKAKFHPFVCVDNSSSRGIHLNVERAPLPPTSLVRRKPGVIRLGFAGMRGPWSYDQGTQDHGYTPHPPHTNKQKRRRNNKRGQKNMQLVRKSQILKKVLRCRPDTTCATDHIQHKS